MIPSAARSSRSIAGSKLPLCRSQMAAKDPVLPRPLLHAAQFPFPSRSDDRLPDFPVSAVQRPRGAYHPKVEDTAEIPVAVLILRIRMSIKYYQQAFPFRYPIILYALYLDGILISIWMWSGHSSASIISTPFLSHNSRNIFPMSFFNAPYTACLRYFGANTIRYLHSPPCVLNCLYPFGLPPLLLTRLANLHHLNAGGLFLEAKA